LHDIIIIIIVVIIISFPSGATVFKRAI